MDEKHFKKHLADLVHGHHHPEEHDWSSGSQVHAVKKSGTNAKGAARRTARKSRRSK